MAATAIKGGASALPTITVEERGTSSFRMFCYRNRVARNPAFDGDAFLESWARFVGSAHRHWQTNELILCWSTNGQHPLERETLRARLEAHPGNVGEVLASLDRERAEWNAAVAAADAGRA